MFNMVGGKETKQISSTHEKFTTLNPGKKI